jgi:hypothetical protein
LLRVVWVPLDLIDVVSSRGLGNPVESANGVLFPRSLQLPVDITVIGAALWLDAKSAVRPQLPLEAQQLGQPACVDLVILVAFPHGGILWRIAHHPFRHPRLQQVVQVTFEEGTSDAREAARQFWEQGSEDMRVSDDARMFCASNMKLFA